MLPLESVPNFSEGRDGRTIDAIGEALASEGARLLDVHVDADHNRSVFTLVGSEAELVAGLVAGVACARERIDLRRHEGVHPRVGAADVVPLVPIRAGGNGAGAGCVAPSWARGSASSDCRCSSTAAPTAGRRSSAAAGRGSCRRGSTRASSCRTSGRPELDPSAGAVLVGARRPLIAFNVNLRCDDVEVARAIAAVVREAGGGFPGVRALGFELPSAGLVQVSMNVEDWEAAPLHEIVARIVEEAEARGVEVAGSELVGLMPAGAAVAAAGAMLRIDGFDESRVLELRLLDD